LGSSFRSIVETQVITTDISHSLLKTDVEMGADVTLNPTEIMW